jgi:hypothetical protein
MHACVVQMAPGYGPSGRQPWALGAARLRRTTHEEQTLSGDRRIYVTTSTAGVGTESCLEGVNRRNLKIITLNPDLIPRLAVRTR